MLTAYRLVQLIILAGLMLTVAHAQKSGQEGRAFTTDLIEIKPGQIARLEVKNNGHEAVEVHLQFTDKVGKVLTQRNVTIAAGSQEHAGLPFVGEPGANRELAKANPQGPHRSIEIRARFEAVGALSGNELLQPVVRIINEANGTTIRSLGPEAFTQIWGDPPAGAVRGVTPEAYLPVEYGFTTVALTFNGQTHIARLTVRSDVTSPLKIRLRFVDANGKVLVQKEATIEPGGQETLEFTGPNNPLHKIDLRAQYGSTEAILIGLLRPSLEIVDRQTRATVKSISKDEFKPLKSTADLRPGNDPRKSLK